MTNRYGLVKMNRTGGTRPTRVSFNSNGVYQGAMALTYDANGKLNTVRVAFGNLPSFMVVSGGELVDEATAAASLASRMTPQDLAALAADCDSASSKGMGADPTSASIPVECADLRWAFLAAMVSTSGFGGLGLIGAITTVFFPPAGAAIEGIAIPGAVGSFMAGLGPFVVWRNCEASDV